MGAGIWPHRAALGARGRLCAGLCYWRWLGLSVGGMVVVMTKDEALRLALEALQDRSSLMKWQKAITAIKAALEAKDEPVAWKWHQAPVKTSWGHEMVVADIAIDKDNTVSVYCERDQTTKVEAMFSLPQRKPLTDEKREEIAKGWRGRNWTVGDIIDAVEAAHGIKGEA